MKVRSGRRWARGVRCVIALSFGDIFYNNCFQNGLLPIRLAAALVGKFGETCADARPLEVDLVECRLRTSDGATIGFEIDEMRRESMFKGLDDIG